MGENAKRSRPRRDNDRDRRRDNDGDRRRDNDGDRHQRRRVTDRDEKMGNDELIVYRILCPDGFIGSVIGKSGKVINSIRQETKARVKVVDPFPGAKDRVITIYCYVKDKEELEVDDEFDDREPLCPAQDALIKVHEAIATAMDSFGDSDKKLKDKEECRLLVPSSQSANIIGKSGVTIKRMRSKTRANVKVNAKDATDPTHSCAMEFDNFLLITGDPEAVKKALFAVSAIMYKFTPKEEISLDTNLPDVFPNIIIPPDVPIFPSRGLYTGVDPRSVPSVLGATGITEYPGYTDTTSSWPVYSSVLPLVSGYTGSSRSGDLRIKVLCPSNMIGRVIGKGGSSIKSLRQATGAHVDVDDAKASRDEYIVTINSTESMDDLKSIAVEAVLLLQGKINDEDDDTVTIRLLVPSRVIGCIIGKSGSIVNEIRKRSKADIHISKGEKPKCADANDELVEVIGKVESVRDALVQIVLRLRDDVLKDRERGHNQSAGADSFYSGNPGHSAHSTLSSVPPVTSVGYEQRDETGSGFGMRSSSSLYGYGSQSVGDDGYGSLPSYSSKLYEGLAPPSTLEMVIPGHAVGKVMGKDGTNIGNIRKISGAVVEIYESKSTRDGRVALISGTSEQKRAAENLIQAFIMAT